MLVETHRGPVRGRKAREMTAASQPGKNPGKKQTTTPAPFEPFIDRAFHEHSAGVGDPPTLADIEPRAPCRESRRRRFVSDSHPRRT